MVTEKKQWNYAYGDDGKKHKFWGTAIEGVRWVKRREYSTNKPSTSNTSSNIEEMNEEELGNEINTKLAELEEQKALEAKTNNPYNLSDDILGSGWYAALDDNAKALVGYFNSIVNDNSEDKEAKGIAFQEALDLAAETADPYWKEIISSTKDEYERSFGALEASYEEQQATLETKRRRLAEDLAYNSQYLSTKEQAELARQKRSYDKEIITLRENMAARGLSSSTIRGEAEELSGIGYEDATESIEREYDMLTREQSLIESRGVEDIEDRLVSLSGSFERSQTNLVRGLESYLGTSEISGLPGVAGHTLGGLTGTIVTDKRADAITLANAFPSGEFTL